MQIFWKKEFKCPVCSNEFEAVRVFSNTVIVKKRDTDFMPIYEGINALYYQMITCPVCLFTAFESDFQTELTAKQKDLLMKALEKTKHIGRPNLSENRDISDAAVMFSIAAIVYTLLGTSRKAAECYLKLGWLFRQNHDSAEEKKALQKALDHFENYYMNEEITSQEEPMILFYLGELNGRLGNKKKAVEWFSLLVQKFDSSSLYARKARERWQDIRQSLRKTQGGGAV